MKVLFNYLDKTSKINILLISFFMIVIIGIVDYLTGYEISFSVFYLLPVVFVVWFHEKSYAIIVSIISASVWLYADAFSGHIYSNIAIAFWNAIMRLGFFLLSVFSLSEIKKLLEREKISSRIDFLTGISNSRAFMEEAKREIERSIRFSHPFTLVYADVDHFKEINDLLGHAQGDALLQIVAKTIKENIRSIDIISRLGGDEFAILLVETDEKNAKITLEKIQTKLLDVVKRNNWSVTFSIGAVTNYGVYNLDELIKEADDLMYTVKKSGKNKIAYKILAPSLN